jgi:predicted transcriptional regulator of viral defense system
VGKSTPLPLCVNEGDLFPWNSTEIQVRIAEFFAAYPVFSLDDAVRVLEPPRGRPGAVERLKHHLKTGRLRLVTKGVYAVVPAGETIDRFRPDPFLVAHAVRSDAIFSHHSALDLLGAAHSIWHQYTLYTAQRRRPLLLDGTTVRFLDHPRLFKPEPVLHLGTRKIERLGKLLEATGPERTLLDGFRRLDLVGGLEELVNSAAGFPILDLDLIEELLHVYRTANLWAAAGWFLEQYRKTFYVSSEILARMAAHRPRSPQYLERNRRGGVLAQRWNLILPRIAMEPGETDEP